MFNSELHEVSNLDEYLCFFVTSVPRARKQIDTIVPSVIYIQLLKGLKCLGLVASIHAGMHAPKPKN